MKRVSFYANDRLLGSITAAAYTFTWKEAKRGPYVLTARATDDQGGRTVSEPVKLTVTR